ncbi:MAG: hypothetical protein ABI672_18775 [Vicinamibacteria bacterium]
MNNGPVGAESPGLTCPQCDSSEVRASRSSYPKDKETIGDKVVSFWRCGNCGARFLGPLAVAAHEKRSRRFIAKQGKSSLDRDLRAARTLKRWLFPAIVILATIFVVIYLLDKRDAPAEQIINP